MNFTNTIKKKWESLDSESKGPSNEDNIEKNDGKNVIKEKKESGEPEETETAIHKTSKPELMTLEENQDLQQLFCLLDRDEDDHLEFSDLTAFIFTTK